MLADETLEEDIRRLAPQSRWAFPLLLMFVFGSLALGDMDAPIVDGYVGRQVPTAMVARNLERGSGFFRPQLDTGPFPNLFLVEPPIFATLTVFVRKLSGWPIGECGRYVSVMAIMMGAWGFAWAGPPPGGLIGSRARDVRVRHPPGDPALRTCLPARRPDARLAVSRVSPVGRSRGRGWSRTTRDCLAPDVAAASRGQGDRGSVVAGPVSRDPTAHERSSSPPRRSSPRCSGTPTPWYVMSHAGGSRASADNAALWSSAIGPMAWFRPGVAVAAARSIVWRAYSPMGVMLALVGLLRTPRKEDRLWLVVVCRSVDRAGSRPRQAPSRILRALAGSVDGRRNLPRSYRTRIGDGSRTCCGRLPSSSSWGRPATPVENRRPRRVAIRPHLPPRPSTV